MALDPNKPHEFVVGSDGIRCQVCARSNSVYGRPYHTPPFQVEQLSEDIFVEAGNLAPIRVSDQKWSRPLTEAEQKAAWSAWPPLPPTSRPIEAPMPSFAEHTFGARSERMRSLRDRWSETSSMDAPRAILGQPNTPAVSNSTGGEPENTNGGTMKLNLTLSAKGVESVLPIIAALNAIDGVKVEDIQEAEKPPVYRSSTRVATDTYNMRRMLREAAENKNAVVLDYTTERGERNRARRVTATHFEDDLLLAVDPATPGRLRSFKLDRIASVTLP
jgi:hypothetical protein